MGGLYVAVIGDIVKSRQLVNRNEVQLLFQSLLEKINNEYSQAIASKFLITLGDEFQGLLTPDAPVYEIISSIMESVHPVQVRFGLGFGALSTHLSETALGMDGPVFYFARDALNTARSRKGYSIAFKSDVLNENEENAINAMLELLSVIRKLWSKKFLKIITLLREGKTQSEIAQNFDFTQPYISELVGKAYWSEVVELEKRVSQLLKNFFGNYHNSKL